MEYLTILLIAISLSFDTFAVSLSNGLILKQITFKQASTIAIVFALFQGVMPLLGWFVGSGVKEYTEQFDHWLAFIILSILGIKMIYESLSHKSKGKCINPLNPRIMIGMAIATSIDALIVGFSFALLNYHIIIPIAIIAIVTYIVAMLGMLFGKKIGNKIGQKMEIVGGIMLILIGVKILIEHLFL